MHIFNHKSDKASLANRNLQNVAYWWAFVAFGEIFELEISLQFRIGDAVII